MSDVPLYQGDKGDAASGGGEKGSLLRRNSSVWDSIIPLTYTMAGFSPISDGETGGMAPPYKEGTRERSESFQGSASVGYESKRSESPQERKKEEANRRPRREGEMKRSRERGTGEKDARRKKSRDSRKTEGERRKHHRSNKGKQQGKQHRIPYLVN